MGVLARRMGAAFYTERWEALGVSACKGPPDTLGCGDFEPGTLLLVYCTCMNTIFELVDSCACRAVRFTIMSSWDRSVLLEQVCLWTVGVTADYCVIFFVLVLGAEYTVRRC